MKRALPALLLAFASLRAGAQLQHHEVRLDKLPKPYHTSSAGNPPRVVARPAGAQLIVPAGFRIAPWATEFENPRHMILSPGGDVLVADTSAGRIIGFRGADPKQRYVVASGLNGPYGMAFRGQQLFVGCEDAVVRVGPSGRTAKVFDLPAGGHSTRNVIFNRDQTKLYIATGSRSNVDDETADPRRAAITEINPDGSGARTFASGLRNPVGLAWNPANGTLWTTVNERDGLGDDLVPDYITEVKNGAFYGWPFSYLGKNVDPRREGEHPELVKRAIPPSLLLQAHSAALGIVFYDAKLFPAKYRGGAFVALHGSWNRSRRTGYSVIHVPFRNGQPAGGYDDFVIGWAPDPAKREVWGRPAGLLVLPDGSLLVADDGGNLIWRVTYTGK
jgi:glucose/arabinose dehydrogenase